MVEERGVGARLPQSGNVGADPENPAVAGTQADAGGTQAADPAAAVVRAAQAEIGIREVRENAGPRVDAYNRYTSVKDAPWCASFVSFCFYQAGHAQPRTAWSPALFPRARCVEFSPSRLVNSGLAAGLVMGIYYPSKGRIAHCGIVSGIDGDWVFSVEGNTNDDGGNEGDGVYAKKRHRRTIAKYADWIKAPLLRRNVPAPSSSLMYPARHCEESKQSHIRFGFAQWTDPTSREFGFSGIPQELAEGLGTARFFPASQ